MATLTCGSGGSTGAQIVAQINTNTGNIENHENRISSNETTLGDHETRITSNETTLGDHETRITSNETAVTNLNSTVGDHESRISTNESAISSLDGRVSAIEAVDPLAAMRLGSDRTLTFTDDVTPILMQIFDTIVVEQGGFDADLATYSITAGVGVNYAQVSIGINAQFPGTEILEFQVFINGSPYAGADFYLKGDGSDKPIAFYWQSIVPLSAGDVIDLRGRNDASGSVDITFRRTHFSIASTVKEIV